MTLQQMTQLIERTTPGEWRINSVGAVCSYLDDTGFSAQITDVINRPDAEFIVKACKLVPILYNLCAMLQYRRRINTQNLELLDEINQKIADLEYDLDRV